MRFKSGVIVGGVLGYLVGRELARRGEQERSPTVQAAMSRHPSSSGFAGFANKAGVKGVEAIQRARASIQKRLVADVDDLSMN